MRFETKFDIGSTVYCIVDRQSTGPIDFGGNEGTLDSGAFRVQSIELCAYWDAETDRLRVNTVYWVAPTMHPSMHGVRVREYNTFSTFKEAREAYAAK